MSKKYLIVALVLVMVASVVYFSQNMKQQTTNSRPSENQTSNRQNPYQISKHTNNSSQINLMINQTQMVLENQKVDRYMYTNQTNDTFLAGMPIIVNQNEPLEIHVQNNTDVVTNVHWHGLSVDNDQDGPGIIIKQNDDHVYQFTPTKSGTYWYHSHERPVRDQVDKGMYGPLIVKDPIDDLYDGDYIMMLDDWQVGGRSMGMEQIGNIDTVNGQTGQGITPVTLKTGEIVKLRFINASTALTHELTFPVPVTITHTDGRALVQTIQTSTLSIAPGERYDVELTMNDSSDTRSFITSSRNTGITIPIEYTYQANATLKKSPFIPATLTSIASQAHVTPDIIMTLSDRMGQKMMSHEWTINNEVFPNLEAFKLNLNQLYTIRFDNKSMHNMDHPMHIHGAHFLVLSINGKPVSNEIWKDTINVPYGQYVDVAISFDKPGEWMVHCHILDHEDGGMMTSIIVE